MIKEYIRKESKYVFYARFGKILQIVTAVVISESAGVIGAVFTMSAISGPSTGSGLSWYAGLMKPVLAPPNWVFGPVWTALYALIGISLYLVWKNNWEVKNRFLESRRRAWNKWSERLWTGDWQKANAIAVFVIQYALNIVWSYLFFGLRMPGLAFFGLLALWLAIFWTIVAFYRISKPAAYLLLPYIIWVGFAGYLNYSIWISN